MKKIFSLIIALTLLVSVFALSAVAFADEGEGSGEGEGSTTTTTRTITVHSDKLMEKVGDTNYLYDDTALFADGKFVGWLTSSADVKAVFEGIVFAFSGEDDYDTNKTNDTVRLEYCTGDPKYEDNWEDDVSDLKVGKNGTSYDGFKLSGWVAFRYSASYKPTSDATEDTTVYTDNFVVYIADKTAPVVEMGTSLVDKVASGLTVGSAYTVSTSSSSVKVVDTSTTTVTYVINKRINGEYVQVYSSVDGLSEDYEGKDIASGTITPTADDVLTEATYQIVYTVTDAVGYSNTLTASFKVNAKATDVEEKEKVDVLKIVLYIVAGLSAVGIVVLLVIKPKQQAPARVVYTETPANDEDTSDEE